MKHKLGNSPKCYECKFYIEEEDVKTNNCLEETPENLLCASALVSECRYLCHALLLFFSSVYPLSNSLITATIMSFANLQLCFSLKSSASDIRDSRTGTTFPDSIAEYFL